MTAEEIIAKSKEIERKLIEKGILDLIDAIAMKNQAKVMDAFRRHRVSDSHFAGTTGYGYDDVGRDTIDKIFADVFEAECAFARHTITSGTHTLAIGLYGLLRPGDTMLSVTGKPYDTLEEVIGIRGEAGNGSLRDFGVNYRQIDLLPDGEIDYPAIEKALAEDKKIKMVFIQRSKGYAIRPTLSAEKIGEIAKFSHERSDAFVVVDNCYGEFVDEHEPTYYGADMIMGSLIKNPGGGMAECGGYIAGTEKAVTLASYRLTCPGIGTEAGASLGHNKNLLKGLFYAPHTVAQAVKTEAFAAEVFSSMGFEVSPTADEERHDIIQTVSLGTLERLVAFCEGIQNGAPIDSFVKPEPSPMPGYAVPVIMAAGAFTQGSSIELSADAPCKEPYMVYLQGGLTYESGKLGIMRAAELVEKELKK